LSLREGPFGQIRVPLAWMAMAALIVALVVAAVLFVGDRRHAVGGPARSALDGIAAPVAGALSAPIGWTRDALSAVGDYVLAGQQNAQLRRQLVVAAAWRDEALALRRENARFRAMMGVKTDPPIPMVLGRTVLEARGPFANTRLADVGSARGVIEGAPVLSEHGLVGRVVGVAPNASRILLLTDAESRTPVMVPRTNARAILTGDGGPNPQLDYVRAHEPLREGDVVMTSGDGGVYPRGLPVGVAARGLDGVWRVTLDADAAPIDLVQILLFRDFAQLVPQSDLAPRTLPSAMTDEAAGTIVGPAAGKP
jgi:rod shape-determining protein MreC